MRILVTGATGFVGRALVTELAARGHAIRATLRSAVDPNTWNTGAQRIETALVGELGPDKDWTTALKNIDAVIHLAARVHMLDEVSMQADELYDAANRAGTECLAHAAVASGARRFVFLSTIKVNGEDSGYGAFRESDEPRPVDPYAVSKWRAEQALHALTRAGTFEPVILRPPLVYGPAVKANFLSLMRAVDRGWPLPLAAVQNRRSLCFLGNLVSAIVTGLEHPGAAGRTYLVADGKSVATPELVRRIGHALGRNARLFPVPSGLMRLGGHLLGRREAVERLVGSLAVDATLIGRELGWVPPFTMDAGLRATAQWYRSSNNA